MTPRGLLLVRAGVLTAAVLLLSLGIYSARAAESFVGRTSPGFLTFQSAFLAPPFIYGDATALKVAGADVMDLAVQVDGRPVDAAPDLWAAAAASETGWLDVRFRRPDGSVYGANLPVRTFEEADLRKLLTLAWVTGLMILASGILPVLLRPDSSVARALFGLSLGTSATFGFLAPDHLLGGSLAPWSFVPASIAVGSFIHLMLLFPVTRFPLTRFPWPTRVVVYGVPILLYVDYVVRFLERPASVAVLDQATAVSYVVASAGLSANAIAALFSPDRDVRARAQLLALVPAAGLVSAFFPSLFGGLGLRSTLTAFFLAVVWALPLTISLGLARGLFFDLGERRSGALTAGLLAQGAAVLYLLLFSSLESRVGPETAWGSAFLSLACLLALFLVVSPLRRRLEAGVGRVLFPEALRARGALREAFSQLAGARSMAELEAILTRAVQEAGSGSAVHIVPAGAPAEPTARVFVLSDDKHEMRVRPLEGGPPDEAQDRHFQALARQAGQSLENAQAWESVRHLTEELEQENQRLREEVELRHEFPDIVGRSPAMQRVLVRIEQAAPSDLPVLIHGETGTGKELVAQSIHQLSERREAPFVRLASAAIPETLFESELFGHERGAFTDAKTAHAGHFETADGGTLLLDDVDALPLAVQAKLLRVLQEGEVQRLGSLKTRIVDVRVLAASNRDLLGEVRAGRFREDLYYRLAVVPIEIPPLRERGDDLLLLAEHFAGQELRKLGRDPVPLSAELLSAIESHDWPGNVRELRNAIERAVVLSRGEEVALPDRLVPRSSRKRAEGDSLTLADSVKALKVARIREALEAAAGNQRAAAEALGMHRQSLNRMMRDLGLR